MDQDLKQRLVGAVVITSLAAIFVPMLFDDPIDETGKIISELKIPDTPIKLTENTYPSSQAQMIDKEIELPKSAAIVEESKAVITPPRTSIKKPNNPVKKERWFVQVGIFSSKQNALSLRDKIRKQGFSVTISTVSGKKGLLYRVRVGPEINKNRAIAAKKKVERLNKIKGIISSVDE